MDAKGRIYDKATSDKVMSQCRMGLNLIHFSKKGPWCLCPEASTWCEWAKIWKYGALGNPEHVNLPTPSNSVAY